MASAYFQYLEILVEVVYINSGEEHYAVGKLRGSKAGPSIMYRSIYTYEHGAMWSWY